MKKAFTNDLAIVVPVYKPKHDWPAVLVKNIREVVQAMPAISLQFIVVNDGFETDALLEMFELLSETYPEITFVSYAQNMGKGYALRAGVQASDAEFVIVTDFDFPYVTPNIVEVYEKLLQGYDVVAGKRCEQYYSAVPLKRKIISKSCIWLTRVFLKLPECDTQSGLKGFNTGGKRTFLDTRINRFLIDTEFLMLAYKRNLIITVIELQLKPAIRFSSMSIKVLIAETKNLVSIVKRKNVLQAQEINTYHVATKNLPDFRLRRV